MLTKNPYYLKLSFSLLLIVGLLFLCEANDVYSSTASTDNFRKDTIAISNNINTGKPNDSIVITKLRKNKLLSKEGIIVKQIANKTEDNKLNTFDSSSNKVDKQNFYAKSTEKNRIDLSKSIINNPFKNNNLTESPQVNLFKQLTDKNNLSKLEFLNTVKQLNLLKKEIYKKNSEEKKTNPIRWLLLLIAAILIIIVLAFFIKELFTLFLISFMLIALVLLIGFL